MMTEYDSEELLGEIKGYKSLNPAEKLQLQLPYINTTLLIDELTKLRHEESGGRVRLFEKAGMRKDRYSSLSYNFYVATQLENKLSRKQNNNSESAFIIKAPNYKGKAVSGKHGRRNTPSWY